ncbi:MAG: SBBP repeat-containing protein, partial [Terriglobia bacterium]
MKRIPVFRFSLYFLLGLAALTQTSSRLPPDTTPKVTEAIKQGILETYGRLPMSFEVNRGQTDPQVRFLSRGGGYTLFLAPTEAVLALREAAASKPQQKAGRVAAALEPETAPAHAPVVLRMKLIGSNSAPRLVGLDELPGKSNYFIGNDPKKWRTNVPSYSKVRYENVYAGVDLIYYGRQGQLEYDFVVAPGAVPDAITLGLEGAERIEIDPQGNLILSMGGGEVSLHKPVVYQEVDGVRREIQGGYALKERNRVGFEVAAYDAGKPLVIDPTLVYSTYLGGGSNDFGNAIAVDGSNSAYVTGRADSSNFPTVAPFQGNCNGCGAAGPDVFVTKFNSTGSALVYSTYLGGSGRDESRGIAVDSSGNAYVTGFTGSTNFPTASPVQAANGGGASDAFVTKFNAAGSALVYS